MKAHRVCRSLSLARAILPLLACVGFSAKAAAQTLTPPPFPPENPFTEEKRILGKILFFEEQLSTDDTMACGTCHVMAVSGSDPRMGRHPGPDGVLNTVDDKLGSSGVLNSDASKDYVADALFGFEPQVTTRSANTIPMAAYAAEVFWDGAAGGEFVDPDTGLVAIASGGALENQIIEPPVSPVEMGHEQRDWASVTAKLERVRPLALATDLPPDVVQVLAKRPSYPDLFESAFGTPDVTALRVAFSIATYERTLIPDQTPWDLFIAGNQTAMTPQQIQGWQTYKTFPTQCFICHAIPEFTDRSFRNVGLRPWQEDPGRQTVTGDFFDRGKFKVPSLRNVGLKTEFMHNGGVVSAKMDSVADVVDFYREMNGHFQFPENRDPEMFLINIAQADVIPLVDFIENGLTDPRVANETFPFDRPTLFSERTPANPSTIGSGTAGQGGFIPQMIARTPPLVGSKDFKIGVHSARGGAIGFVRVWSPPAGHYGLTLQSPRIVLEGAGPGAGHATWHWELPDIPTLVGTEFFLQWFVEDPAAAGGFAASAVAHITLL